MPDRYYNTVTKVEEFGPGTDIVILPPENPFWSPLPAGQRLTYDGGGVPNGLEPIPAPTLGSPAAVQNELLAAGISYRTVAQAMYLDHLGDSSLLTTLDAAINTVATNQSVTYAVVIAEL